MEPLDRSDGQPSRIDSMRRLAELAHRNGNAELLEVAWSTFENWTRDLLAFAPGDPDLSRWQEIALDFEVAFEDKNAENSANARRLAAELRAAITMIERNPADKVAKRPTAMRVLRALATLGAEARLVEVRESSGLGATHLSNILKPLISHGYVTVASDPSDGRGRRVSLTARGLSAASAVKPGDEPREKVYRDRIHVESVRSAQFATPGRIHAGNGSHPETVFKSSLAAA